MLVWLFGAAIVLFFVAPTAALFSMLNIATLDEVIGGAAFAKSVYGTVVTGLVGAALSTLLGVGFARPFASWEFRGKRQARLLAIAPYLIPNFVLASSYVIAWNPVTGLLSGWVPLPFGLYGKAGMSLLFGVVHVPLALLMLEDRFRRIDGALIEAARLAGASGWAVFRRIELPLITPAVIGAFGLCFALNVSAFAIPAWIGAPERIYPLAYKIYQALQVSGSDGMATAAVYAGALYLLIVPVMVVAWIGQRSGRRLAMATGKSSKSAVVVPGRAALGGFVLTFVLYQLVTLVLPFMALGLTTVTVPGCLQESGVDCLHDLTFRAYHYVLFDLAETRLAFWGSGVWGTVSTLLIIGMALVCLGVTSHHRRIANFLEGVFSLATATPGAIIALGLIIVASGQFWVNLYNTPWIVVAAMMLKHQSLAWQPLRMGLLNISLPMTEAARLAGAGPVTTWRRIVLPIMKPEIIGATFLVLIPILGELTMSVFLTGPSYRSIGTVLFDLQDYADQAAAGALAVVLVFLIFLANFGSRKLSGGRVGY